MIGSGLPLLDSMESIKDTVKVKRLKDALDQVIKAIAQGESLSGAFSRRPEVFPERLIVFCSIGEETDHPTALNNTAEYLKKVDDRVPVKGHSLSQLRAAPSGSSYSDIFSCPPCPPLKRSMAAPRHY
jgi:hypothetical protein